MANLSQQLVDPELDSVRGSSAERFDVDSGRHRARWRPRRHGLFRWPIFSGTVLVLFIFTGIFGRPLAPHNPDKVDLNSVLKPPVFDGGTWSYPLGTDELGRDIFSRILAGCRVSLYVALAVVLIAGVIGLGVALLGSMRSGRLDSVLTRLTDASMAFPYLLLAVILVATFGASLTIVIVVLVLAGWPQYARVLRSEILKIRSQDFITMSRIMGGNNRWIVTRHVVPNIANTLLVLATLQVGLAIMAEGSLSFLGIGVPPPAASWGGMLAEGRNYLTTAWWLPVVPAVCLIVTVMAANLAGDWLRTRSDPTTRR